jgi:hypothetical protein
MSGDNMEWQPIGTAPVDGSIIWVADANSICVGYFNQNAWRNWFKGPRYENAHLGAEAFAPEQVWFEPTHWQPTPQPPLPAAAQAIEARERQDAPGATFVDEWSGKTRSGLIQRTKARSRSDAPLPLPCNHQSPRIEGNRWDE